MHLFHDNFTTCRDRENSDIDAAFKEYASLTVAQGQIRLGPGPKEKVKAFIQWVRDQFLLDLDPASVPFPVQDTSMYLRHSKTMEHFQAKAKRMAELAKPQIFRSNMKWEDWYPSFANLLRHQPGRDGVPLSYVIRDRDQPDHTPKDTYLDCLVAAAPHFGESFREDADTVHTLITKYIAGNADAEAKIQRHDQNLNGRKDIQALRAHYEGVGANSLDIRRADKILHELHYGGERRPHMWWAEFEKQLTSAFHYYHKHEEREVYSNAMKIRILLRKVHADFLIAHKAAIEKDIGEPNNTVTYESALTTFRNAVNAKFPPQLTPQRARRIQEAASARNMNGGRGRGRNARNNRNRGRGRGRGNPNTHSGVKRQREDSTYEMLEDGTFLEIHPSFSYPDATWRMIPYATRKRLMDQRAALRARNNPQRSVQQADQSAHDEISQLSQSSAQTPSQTSPTPVTAIQVQQTDRFQQGSHNSWQTIMGGRKEQESKRRLGALRSTRHVSRSVGKTTSSPTIGQEPSPNTSARNETDTNADTCCLGTNFRILNYTGRVADVSPYDKSYPAVQGVPIVTGVTAWDEPSTGTTHLLIIHEGLYYGTHLDHSLINPNQVRHNGIEYNDNPFEKRNDLAITTDAAKIPLHTAGTKIYWNTRSPTDHELHTCPQIVLTSDTPWEPETVILAEATSRHPTAGDNMEPQELDTLSPTFAQLRETQRIADSTSILSDVPSRRTFISSKRHSRVTAEDLAERWLIGLNQARATMHATTQRGLRSAILPLSRRYRADKILNIRRLDDRFSTDTFFADTCSKGQNKCAQVFSTKAGFTAIYPLRDASADSIGQALNDFIHDYGVPTQLVFDGAASHVGHNTLFMKTVRKHDIRYHVSEPRRPNQNPAEGAIRELKRKWYRLMSRNQVHPRLWDHAISWLSEIGNMTVSTSRYANGRTSIEMITGETPDITEHLDFSFYDWVTYIDNAGLGDPRLGRWLGVSHRVGPLMSYWVLTETAEIVSRTTVQRLTNLEKKTDEMKRRIEHFTLSTAALLQAQSQDIPIPPDTNPWLRLTRSDDPEMTSYLSGRDSLWLLNQEVYNDKSGQPTGDLEDNYINMEIALPRGDDDQLQHARVKRRAVDQDGKPIGQAADNPMLDTRKYIVQYLDGTVETLTANTIATNLFAQVDEDGHRQLFIDDIIAHRCDESAIKIADGTYMTATGVPRKKRTTRGWYFCVQWVDGSTDWVPLKDIKDSYPVQVAEYVRANKLDDEPAFAWWVPYTMKKRMNIIAKLKTKYWQRTHKYGIRIPKSTREAKEIDAENGDTLWQDAIRKEMDNVRVAFQLYENDPKSLLGYQEVQCHLIFDVKLGENFRRKARLVCQGNRTETPSSVTYSSVVSRDSVRICLTIAALNDLQVMAADIQNAYLSAPCREKVWCRAGPEFGPDEGKPFLIVRALYGLKSSGAAFRAHLAERLHEMGFRPTMADPDVWLRPAVKPDGEKYYEYILVYVDDLLGIGHDANNILDEVRQEGRFRIKGDKIAEPENYLGATVAKKSLNGLTCWTMSSVAYIKAAVANVEEKLGRPLSPKRGVIPLPTLYRPELEDSIELEPQEITYYQELIGILRWAIELGRVDILHEVSLMSAYQAAPRQGHLNRVLDIFAYLKQDPKKTLYFSPELPLLDEGAFTSKRADFRERYGALTEPIPPGTPEPRGRGSCILTAFVDAAHASNRVTRRSHTGYLIFLNRAPIIWYSKRQKTVEASTFSSEFIALKACTEAIIALRYKLRQFGVAMDAPANVLCDNQGVVHNTTRVESTLQKKHNAIAYHFVREQVAAGTIRVGKVASNANLADPLTKVLPLVQRTWLFDQWMF